MSHTPILHLIYLFISSYIFLSLNACVGDIRAKRQDIYEIIWWGDAKNNCNLIEGRGFFKKKKRKKSFRGMDKENLNETRQKIWRHMSFSLETQN